MIRITAIVRTAEAAVFAAVALLFFPFLPLFCGTLRVFNDSTVLSKVHVIQYRCCMAYRLPEGLRRRSFLAVLAELRIQLCRIMQRSRILRYCIRCSSILLYHSNYQRYEALP